MQIRPSDREIADLAERQHGVVARRQLLELGLGRDAIRGRVASGRLHRMHPGVYAVGHQVVSQKGRWMAAVLACGAGAALSHRSAAALWGIATFRGAIEVTSPRSTRSRGAIRRHCARLPSDEVTVRDGIPSHRCTGPSLTTPGSPRSIASRPRCARPSTAAYVTVFPYLPCLLVIPATAATRTYAFVSSAWAERPASLGATSRSSSSHSWTGSACRGPISTPGSRSGESGSRWIAAGASGDSRSSSTVAPLTKPARHSRRIAIETAGCKQRAGVW